jgi:hypothetical protein
MSDAPSSGEPKRSLLERLSALLLRAPEDREQLLSLLRTSHERELLDDDALSMIEGVLQVAELSTRDIMVPRSQIKLIDISRPRAVPAACHRHCLALSRSMVTATTSSASCTPRPAALVADDPPEVRCWCGPRCSFRSPSA